MKYPKVVVLSLSDGSFFICVPLMGKDLKKYKRELLYLFRRREESISNRKSDIFFLSAITSFSKEEIEGVSNKIIAKIIRGEKDENKQRPISRGAESLAAK